MDGGLAGTFLCHLHILNAAYIGGVNIAEFKAYTISGSHYRVEMDRRDTAPGHLANNVSGHFWCWFDGL